VVSYERLVSVWQLKPEEAIRGISWVIDLVKTAIYKGEYPPK
jgi:hypothetical protein